jgi:hypothetical protein
VSLQSTNPRGLPVTYSARAETLASYLQQTYGIDSPGTYYTNHRGQGEKYLVGQSSADGYPGPAGSFWYYLLPNGDFYEFTPPYSNGALTGVLVAHLGAAYYDDPTLLTAPSAAPPPVTLSVAANQLTIAPGSGYTDSFVVVASVSDGRGGGASRTFRVTVQ